MAQNWFNASMVSPPEAGTYTVKDSLNGPEYKAHYAPYSYTWTLVSFPSNMTPLKRPVFWLSHA